MIAVRASDRKVQVTVVRAGGQRVGLQHVNRDSVDGIETCKWTKHRSGVLELVLHCTVETYSSSLPDVRSQIVHRMKAVSMLAQRNEIIFK